MKSVDFLVIGGGIIGVNVARSVKRSLPCCRITVIEKEKQPGIHSSGRNSGVIHAGFYYSADSLKAKLTQLGNRALVNYCEEHKLPMRKCGKLVVAKDAKELPVLDELMDRGQKNGVPLQIISSHEARKIEPRVRTFEKALFSPTTASISPHQVLNEMIADSQKESIEFCFDTMYLKKGNGFRISTSQGEIEAGHVINAAGLYADRVANDFGFSKNYRILGRTSWHPSNQRLPCS